MNIAVQVKLPYHVRVLIPCYKEELEIVQKTVIAARTAILPEGVARTIYLCDDGKDPEKRAWVNSLGPDVVYVSGRYRKKGEMNGKSGNLNNVARQLYPAVSLPCSSSQKFLPSRKHTASLHHDPKMRSCQVSACKIAKASID